MDEGLMILYRANLLLPGEYMIPDGKTCDCVSDFFDPIIPASYHVSLIRDLMLSGF